MCRTSERDASAACAHCEIRRKFGLRSKCRRSPRQSTRDKRFSVLSADPVRSAAAVCRRALARLRRRLGENRGSLPSGPTTQQRRRVEFHASTLLSLSLLGPFSCCTETMATHTFASPPTRFTVDIPQSEVDELHFRLDKNRWPAAEIVPEDGTDDPTAFGLGAGPTLPLMKELAKGWRKFDWKKAQDDLNTYTGFPWHSFRLVGSLTGFYVPQLRALHCRN